MLEQAADVRSQLLWAAQHAAEVFDVSLAVITMTDPAVQVWYDRAQAVAGTATESPLPPCCHALNAAVLANGSTLSSEDPVRDPRFTDAGAVPPVVTADPLRLFAGTPLERPSGAVVGTLCLYDRAPRALGVDELAVLATMGRELLVPLDAEVAGARRRTPKIVVSSDVPWQPDAATT